MRFRIVAATSLVFLSFVVPAARAQGSSSGRYIVVLKDGADPARTARDHGRRYGAQERAIYRHAIRGYAATIPEARVAALRSDPEVAYVAPDRRFKIAAQVTSTGARRIRTANAVNQGAGVNVAIVDTGIDLTHPDLSANIAGGRSCVQFDPSYDDGNGHGTHVAGIVAAENNTIGVRGVAPQASLWSVRVLDSSGSGDDASVVCGLDFVDSMSPANGGPITVANMSLEAPGIDDGNCGLSNGDPFHQAICSLIADGVTVVAAAGNEGVNISHGQPGNMDTIPAAYNEVITASALADSDGLPCGVGGSTAYGPDDTFASFSNYATTGADRAHLVAAPGVSIVSTYLNGGYASISGTSMASPHVAGAAALYIAENPGVTPAQVLNALKSNGESPGVNFAGECSSGSSHTNPSGLHPEPLIAILPEAQSISPPTTLTGPAAVTFAHDVTGVDSTNIVMRLTSGGADLPATVSYDASSFVATLQPASPLVAGEYYTIYVAPTGSTPILDNGTPLAPSSHAFRASQNEQELSPAARYLWRTVSDANAYGGKQIMDRTPGAWVTYRFTGPGISWYTMRGPDQGMTQVSIDGIVRGTYDNYRSSVEYRVRRSWSLPTGAHTIRLIAQGTKNVHSTNTFTTVDAFSSGGPVDLNPTLTIAWRRQASTPATDGYVTQNRTSLANVYFHFRGTGLDWLTLLGPDQGIAKVYVDGAFVAQVDNYASSARAFTRAFHGLADGVHDLRIIVQGTKRAAATNTTVTVDGWHVL